jgi:hypothetical protein
MKKTLILSVVLSGCKASTLTLREEYICRLRVFKNTVLRIISGPMREEVVGGWQTFGLS